MISCLRNMGSYFTIKVTLLYSFIIFDLIVSVVCKKLTLQSLEVNSKKLNECGRCRVYVDSFNHWLDKTSRGKFEGGDAAWEETKLKSYSRSEVRLVEIQEGLCSELKKHQDPCYVVAEEAEHALEEWWFWKDTNSIDLYTWLCIETMQDCCPENHFGSSCDPCPLDKNNKVCGGHGKCDGEGTRKGNGTCVCSRGYTGKYCEDCLKGYYSVDSECTPCHKACNECSGSGAANCKSCKSGWAETLSGECIDINECLDPSTCQSNEYCINGEGSHSCKLCDKSCKTCVGGGIYNCTSCVPGSVLWYGECVDTKAQNTLKRMALYCTLFLLVIFIGKYFKLLAAIIMVVFAIYVYYYEQAPRSNVIDLLSKFHL